MGRASNAFNKKVFFSPAFIHTTLAFPATTTPFNFGMLVKKSILLDAGIVLSTTARSKNEESNNREKRKNRGIWQIGSVERKKV